MKNRIDMRPLVKGHTGDPSGPPGPQGILYGRLESVFEFAERTFGVKKENVLLGYKKEPPEVKGYQVYIYYNGGGAEFFVFRNDHWINWSYTER